MATINEKLQQALENVHKVYAAGQASGGGIAAPTYLVPGAAEAYVCAEAHEVASKVRNLLEGEYKDDNCTVAICISDSHYYPDTYTKDGVWSAVNAIKSLTYMIPVDFIAHLGDVADENQNVQPDNALQISRMNTILGYLKECSANTIPLFVAVGNHDTSVYITKDNPDDVMSAEYLYNNFTSLANIDGKTVMCTDKSGGGYCYRDFDDKKLRVYLLNTGEKTVQLGGNDDCTSETQRAWVASTLKELNTKSDASEWGFIVLCHYPCDYGSNKDLSNLFEAYVNGKSITLTGTSYNFAGSNVSKFLAQFHGHVHNFLVDRLYYGAVSSRTNGTPTEQYNAYRIGIPNAQYNRENYYYNTDTASTDGTLWGIKFFEGNFSDLGASAKATKTPNSANDTSFVVNVINQTKNLIHSFAYGAGYDRVISLEGVKYYSVIQSLTNVTSSNTATYVEEGKEYIVVLTPAAGCEFKSVTVTMGGVDITDTAYSSGTITIAEVKGDISITAKASAIPKFTNLVPTAIDTDGSVYNGGLGYIDNRRIDSSGALVTFSGTSSTAATVTTGFIKLTPSAEKIIRVAGDGIHHDTVNNYCRFAFYDSNFAIIGGNPWGWNNLGTSQYTGIVTEEPETAFTFTANKQFANGYDAAYVRITAHGKGENLIVTVDEPIEYET